MEPDCMSILETEVKFFIDDVTRIRRAIIGLGAESEGRWFETNLRFEDQQKSLRRRKALLRLRQARKTTLTFKSSPPQTDRQVKALTELEVEVSDFANMKAILESLGCQAEQVYEKWRETLTLDTMHFCLDTMPYGTFVEIEGPREDIRRYAGLLGLSWPHRILRNYLELFDMVKTKEGLNFSDVTFANFEGVAIDMARYLDQMAEGPRS
jgi:adenylate cyclase class 2